MLEKNTMKETLEPSQGDFNTRLTNLENDIRKIHERNKQVETHKSWETSRSRLAAVTIITYVTMILVFSVLGSARPLLDALVPTAGFFLSTLSLPFVRRVWEKNARNLKD